MKKQELRALYKQKRKDLTEIQIKGLQENIYQQIYSLDFSTVKNVHLFLSMSKFKEIDTTPLITYFRNKNKRIVVSKCNFKDNTLSHFYLEKDTVLSLNKFGVLEPVAAELVDENKLDLIFIPMLISDDKKFRVGYGKGFYDRFLLKCRADARLIGLNFFPPIQKITDVNEFDVSLDQIIYPL
ncbi:MAG: 5-formyltetrahydrofolate cyclo-ligase [Polaribacter sp.]|jgi:5-formyltetrahydrofolate cyclo-ligase|uniref:5-formyltetrahydrofolate cyclo-ligase n=1 Tax=Polaribacter sp. TaxID=1920175 RepID=UPI00384C11CF